MESKRPGVACYWNTSEVKEETSKMEYEGESKENQSNNEIRQTKPKKKKLHRKKRNKIINDIFLVTKNLHYWKDL